MAAPIQFPGHYFLSVFFKSAAIPEDQILSMDLTQATKAEHYKITSFSSAADDGSPVVQMDLS